MVAIVLNLTRWCVSIWLTLEHGRLGWISKSCCVLHELSLRELTKQNERGRSYQMSANPRIVVDTYTALPPLVVPRKAASTIKFGVIGYGYWGLNVVR